MPCFADSMGMGMSNCFTKAASASSVSFFSEWVALREGDIDWVEVYRALADIGYHGTATVELDSGDAAYLREVSRRFDLILSGEKS